MHLCDESWRASVAVHTLCVCACVCVCVRVCVCCCCCCCCCFFYSMEDHYMLVTRTILHSSSFFRSRLALLAASKAGHVGRRRAHQRVPLAHVRTPAPPARPAPWPGGRGARCRPTHGPVDVRRPMAERKWGAILTSAVLGLQGADGHEAAPQGCPGLSRHCCCCYYCYMMEQEEAE